MATTPKVSDQAVKKATGRDWQEWVALLDAAGAAKMTHADIARMVHEKFDGGDWWIQTVSVGYEQMRGRRELHQKAAGFEVSRSKTIAAPIAKVFKAWLTPASRQKWLADPQIDITTSAENKTLRFLWSDGKTRAATYFIAKGERTAVTVQHTKLDNAKAAEKMKKYWGAQLDALAEHLESVRR